jgi:polysaccharide pyruvyl transferase WcaK-like protein/chemotaxis methyl-accepting protein methylase
MKITFFGHFGSPNPGNESTLIAILARLRSLYPDGEFRCICTNPQAVIARDGIEATQISTRTASVWDRDVPLAKRVPMAFGGVGAELAQYVRAFRELKRTDMLIVPGTGVVTNAFGLSNWGPYSQFKWVLMAKLRRCKVMFVSIGAGPIYGTLGRILVKATLSLADYRSYRDEASRNYLAGIGVRSGSDPIYPDLVFSLPEALLPLDPFRSTPRRRVVGLGLMESAGRYSVADPRPEAYTAYLEALVVFAKWLLERDYDIRLLLGDADSYVIDDFRSALRAQLGSHDEGRIIDPPSTSVGDILAEIAACDVVVATRFHNVLFSMLLDKAVMAISFHHKCSSLMHQLGLSDYCLDFNQMDADELIRQFESLERNEEAVKSTIARGTAGSRAALEEQYEFLFDSPRLHLGTGEARERDWRRPVEVAFLRLNQRIWPRIPERVRGLQRVEDYGGRLHQMVRRRADREMYLGTLFLRNRPALELMRRIVEKEDRGARVRIAVLGCSIGVEAYSIVWTLRRSRPDLELDVRAVDISPEVVEVARRGVYSPAASELVNASIFDGLTEAERMEMFDWERDQATIKPWLRDGITWEVGDAGDPGLISHLGPQDLVIASNFLCHMEPRSAESCLRNLARLGSPGGHLFVTGVDLDVRTRVARELGWEPIPELRAEIHDGDRLVRADWPWRWWGLEPLDRRRPDWETRYTATFRVPTSPSSAERQRGSRSWQSSSNGRDEPSRDLVTG